MPVPDLLSDHDTVRRRQEAARVSADESLARVLASLRSLRADVAAIPASANGHPINASSNDIHGDTDTINSNNNNHNSNHATIEAQMEAAMSEMTGIDKDMRALAKALSSGQKAVGGSLIKLGKTIDSNTTSTGLSNLCAPSVLLDSDALNEAICQHLFRDGLYTLGEMFAEEAAVNIDEAEMKPFRRLHEILVSFRAGDLRPAIAWIQQRRGNQSKQNNNNQYIELEVRLHRLEYLKLLQDNRRDEALLYARKELGRFPQYLHELGKLMTCLIYCTNLSTSPYAHLCSESVWNDLERTLIREYCAGKESNLITIVRCGAKAIPSLLKASRVAPNWKELVNLSNGNGNSNNNGNNSHSDVLPVEVPLGNKNNFQFHSIFTCPVYREETNDGNNVPMLLPCGHVLSKHCIARLPKGQNRFKCPYCPREQMEKDCQEVHF